MLESMGSKLPVPSSLSDIKYMLESIGFLEAHEQIFFLAIADTNVSDLIRETFLQNAIG